MRFCGFMRIVRSGVIARISQTGPAPTSGCTSRSVGEAQPEQRDDALRRFRVELAAAPQRVADPRRLGIEADEPRPVLVLDPVHRLDLHLDGEEMAYPGRHCRGKAAARPRRRRRS